MSTGVVGLAFAILSGAIDRRARGARGGSETPGGGDAGTGAGAEGGRRTGPHRRAAIARPSRLAAIASRLLYTSLTKAPRPQRPWPNRKHRARPEPPSPRTSHSCT